MGILLFGASGKVGRLVVDELLARGETVRAFIHRRQLPERDGLECFRGDINIRADIEAALEGVDVVISTLGSWGTEHKNVLSTWADYVVPSMDAKGLRRLISLTGDFAAAPDDPKQPLTRRIAKAGFSMVAPKVLRDGEDHLATIARSSLDWTVLRSPPMQSGGSIRYRLDTKPGLYITRTAVAQAICDQIKDTAWVKAAPYVRA